MRARQPSTEAQFLQLRPRLRQRKDLRVVDVHPSARGYFELAEVAQRHERGNVVARELVVDLAMRQDGRAGSPSVQRDEAQAGYKGRIERLAEGLKEWYESFGR